MPVLTDKEYNRCVNLFSKIIRSIIPINDWARLEDYVHDCIYYVVRKRQQDPTCELKTSYLKHIAVKTCVDSLRSLGTNIKYYCPLCGDFSNRKEKAIECCGEYKKDGKVDASLIQKGAGIKQSNNPLYSVSYNELSIGAVSIMEDSQEMIMLEKQNETNPENFIEKYQFLDEFYGYLSEIQVKIVNFLVDGVNSRDIKKALNIEHFTYVKEIKEIRFTYKWIKSKSE